MHKQKIRIEYLIDSMNKNMSKETVARDQIAGADVD